MLFSITYKIQILSIEFLMNKSTNRGSINVFPKALFIAKKWIAENKKEVEHNAISNSVSIIFFHRNSFHIEIPAGLVLCRNMLGEKKIFFTRFLLEDLTSSLYMLYKSVIVFIHMSYVLCVCATKEEYR